MLDFTHLSPKNSNYKKANVVVANGATFTTLVMSKNEMHNSSCAIYLHLHRESRKCYVGITIQVVGKRWSSGTGYALNKSFGRALAKYGWDAFDSFILAFSDDRNILNMAEITAIAAAGGHKSKFTYNLSPGGDLVAENDKPIVGVYLATGEVKRFKSGAKAARQFAMKNVDTPMAVVRGELTSAKGWWFRLENDVLAEPPELWGEELRVDAVRRARGKRVIAINYSTGEQITFATTAEAAKILGINQSSVSCVANGEDYSANGWWFKFEGDTRIMPTSYGQKVGRLKRDKKVYATNLNTGDRHEFCNCAFADSHLGIYSGAAAAVASGNRASAADWWFSYDMSQLPPTEFGRALVAKARSKAIIATNIATGLEEKFVSAKLAAEKLGMSRAAISIVIKGKLKSSKGYTFRFA